MSGLSADSVRDFLRRHSHAVLVTRRPDGGVQSSPVSATLDDEGRAVISSRQTAVKVRHLRADPRAQLCAFTADFFGPWVYVEGDADILDLPEALEPLVAYYRAVAGEHPDWTQYREAMVREQRVLIRIPLDRVGPSRHG